MSTWRCLLKDIAEAGGDDLSLSCLPGWGVTHQTRRGRRSLIVYGLIKPVGSRRHSLTPMGWRVAEGVADIIPMPTRPGRTGRSPCKYSLVIKGGAVPDIVIEDLLAEAGHQPGSNLNIEVLRAYSARLVAVARASA